MTDYRAIEQKIQHLLGGPRRPVAITFTDTPPAGVEKFSGSEPSSCSFWRIAAGGRVFYTVAADHRNCPIGSYTHTSLQPERMPELQQTLELMGSIGYIRMEEVPGCSSCRNPPRRWSTPRWVKRPSIRLSCWQPASREKS
jgi:hypothetical protein